MTMTLGPPERSTTVEVRADGGQAIYSKYDYEARYTMIYVDVFSLFC